MAGRDAKEDEAILNAMKAPGLSLWIAIFAGAFPAGAVEEVGSVHSSCHDDQLRKLDLQMKRMSAADLERHPELKAESERSREIIRQGNALNEKINQAWKQAEKTVSAAL